jgi:enamine deaminase RidA (YjgF/YER057c/UK114 family)
MHMLRNPATIAPPPPRGKFSHAVEVARNLRWLYISGQSGVRPDGTTPEDFTGQAEATFANLSAVLSDAGMDVGDLVKIVVYFLRTEDQAECSRIRNEFLGEHRPAATMLRISGLAVPGWLIEVEAVAAKA